MSVTLADQKFEGPFLTTSPIREEPGVYLVVGAGDDGQFMLVDAGEAENVRRTVDNHSRRACWDQFGFSKLAIAVSYTPGKGQAWRREVEGRIRAEYDPPCGRA
ncbi:MAG: hypothetical protein Kow0025_05570 [Thermodesulfovibrionales bacterium]